MGKNNKTLLMKILSHTGKIAATTLAAALIVGLPVYEGITSSAAETNYDAQIADIEKTIEQINKDNADRKAKIDNYTGDISENKEAMDTISAQIDGVNSEITTYGQLITIKQQEIADKENEIYAKELEIEDTEEEIAAKKDKIAKLEEENEKNLEKFSQLARVLYMNDSSATLPILNGSDDWYNFFVYSDVVQNLSAQNLDFMNSLLDSIHGQELMIEQLNEDINQLEADQETLKSDKKALEDKMAELESDKADLEAHVAEQYNDLYAIAAKNEELSDKVDNLNYMISRSNEEIEQFNADIQRIIREKQSANSGQTDYSANGFRWPLDSKFQMITTYFGYDAWRGGNHYGIDVGNAGIGGQNIYAAQSGTVITAKGDGGYNGGFGNYIIVDHGGGVCTLYAHCSAVAVYEGQTVNYGDVIGYVGSTGWSTGNHLHFEVRVNGTSVDPFGYTYIYP